MQCVCLTVRVSLDRYGASPSRYTDDDLLMSTTVDDKAKAVATARTSKSKAAGKATSTAAAKKAEDAVRCMQPLSPTRDFQSQCAPWALVSALSPPAVLPTCVCGARLMVCLCTRLREEQARERILSGTTDIDDLQQELTLLNKVLGLLSLAQQLVVFTPGCSDSCKCLSVPSLRRPCASCTTCV